MLFYTSNNLERKKEEDDDTRRYTRRWVKINYL
jgi:hypothetical protein